MKRSIILFLSVFVATTVCAQVAPIKDDNDAAVRAASIAVKYRLTKIKAECLYFDTDDEGKDYLVRVREKHSKACGGDPDISLTSFFLRLRKVDGHATTTAYNLDGNFEELRPVSASDANAGK
jgi:hypothetical protein